MRPEYLHFVRWVNHDSDCMGRFGDPQPCTCGLREAIRSFEATAATAAVPLDRAALAIDLLEALSALDGSKDVALDVTRPAIARNHLRAALARLSADEEGGDLATEYAAEDEDMERLAAAKEADGYDDD